MQVQGGHLCFSDDEALDVGLYGLRGGLVAHNTVVRVVDVVEYDGFERLVAVGSDQIVNGVQSE